MKQQHAVFFGGALASFFIGLTGCSSTPTALSPVGPGPGSSVATAVTGSKGFLQVYSATEKSVPIVSDDSVYFNTAGPNLHSGYDIQDTGGRTLQFVPNHASNMDEFPDQVKLPAGDYQVVAESTWCGQVIVPVVIRAGETTVVHLDNNWWPGHTGSDQLVYLPNGEAAGWHSSL